MDHRRITRLTWRLAVGAVALVLLMLATSGVCWAQSFPRCISGCTANDVELVRVSADVLGSCTAGGTVETRLWATLHFNRNKTYCVRFVADVYIDGKLAISDMVSEPFNVFSKGAYPDIYVGTVTVPCGSSLTLENVMIMWSVDRHYRDGGSCADGSCDPYGPGSKCTGDQLGTIVIALPLDAADDQAETEEDVPVTIDVLANDLLGATPSGVASVRDGAHGTVRINADGTVAYSPDPDYHGTDSFSYTLQDSAGSRDEAWVSVIVDAVNDGPTAMDDASSTDENALIVIDLLGNDTDPDGNLDSSSVQILSGPSRGTVDVDPATGRATFSPAHGDCGSDLFTYIVSDNEGATSNEAAVRIDIRCNEPPAAGDDSATTDENTSIEINVVANDRDRDGALDLTSIRIASQPTFGTLSVHPSSGVVTYMPDPLSCGDDVFSYTIADDDGERSNVATVTVAVLCDDPPLAIDDLYHVDEGATLAVSAPGVTDNDISSPGDVLQAVLVSDVVHGSLALHSDGSFTYVHDGGETASDEFTYFVSDGTKDSNVATVKLIVQPTNDVPDAKDDRSETFEDAAVTIDVLANDTDPDGDTLFVDWVARPAHGLATHNGAAVIYTPDPDYHGTDAFRYIAADGHGGSAEAIVTVVVSPVNDPPMAQDDSASTNEDTPVDIPVLNNDTDPDGDSLTIQSATRPGHGSVSIRGSLITYTPELDFSGSDTFSYTSSDGQGGTSAAFVTVHVAEVNDLPLALDDGASTDEDTAVDIDVLANDTDPEGGRLIVESVSQPAYGTVINNGSSATYVPDKDITGDDEFTYTVRDEDGGKATATVFVTVLPQNDPPTAYDDGEGTLEDTPVTIDVLENDDDPDGDVLAIDRLTNPGHGQVSIQETRVQYTPDPDFNGTDSFTYVVSDGHGETATATVTVVVAPVNDPPTPQDDVASTPEEESVSIAVLDNDDDPDGDALTLVSLTQPTHGTADRQGGIVVYMPDPDFNGTDSFTYVVSDGAGESASAIVTMTVTPVNDPPVAQDDSSATQEETLVSIPVLANDLDPDGDFLVVESVGTPAHGTIINAGNSISYVPNTDFAGIDTFTYVVSDNNGGTSTATVTVAVAAVNDPPIAQDDSASTDEDLPVSIAVLGNDSDPDGDEIAIQSVTQPAHGSAVKDGRAVVYTPDDEFHGVDTFTYTLSDGHGGTSTATVTVAVVAVNDPPIAQDDSAVTSENTPVAVDVLPNDSDPDGDDLSIQSLTAPDHGSVVNDQDRVLYTPDLDFHGVDTFTYTLSDGHGGTSTATVTVAVAAVNDPPAARDDSADTEENTAVTIDVLSNDSDPDEDSLSVQSVTQPGGGSVVNGQSQIVYTPRPGFSGIESFTYVVTDGHGETASATVTVTVAAVNDPPLAQDDSATTVESSAIDIDVLANDSDSDGDSLSIQSLTQPDHGSAVDDGAQVVYTPDAGFSGADSFTYTVTDGQGETATATVTVSVAAVNDPPLARADSATTPEDSVVTISVIANDSDPEGDPLIIESVTQPSHGTVVTSGFSIIYTPDPDFVGADTFTYTITDARGGRSTAEVGIMILQVNDPPRAQDDAQTTREGVPVDVLVLANDADPDGDTLRIESVTQPANGTVVNEGGLLTYTPASGTSGTDSFQYVVSDGNGGTGTAYVTILVQAVNDPPLAQDDSVTTDVGTLVVIPVLANDSDPDGDFLLIESFTSPQHGSVLNARTNLSYIPDAGFEGTDTFSYTTSDGNGGSSQATVTVSVAGVNEAPIAQDDSAITDEGVSVTVPVLLNDTDPDGDPLVIESIASLPEHGRVEIQDNQLIYTPDAGFDGVESFSYTVSDTHGGTSIATVFVAVTPVNDAPFAQDDSSTSVAGEVPVIPVLINDADADGDPLTIVSVTQPTNGTVTIVGSDLQYQPDDGFTGTDSFTYTISDPSGSTDTATVTVGVNPEVSGAGGATTGDASCEGRVVIHEIAWAGTSADSRDEWIELRNLGSTPVDLTGWVLRWRSTHPASAEDQVWKVVELSGEIAGASTAVCTSTEGASDSGVRIESRDGIAWQIAADGSARSADYYVIERRHEDTVRGVQADLLYDTSRTLSLELSDSGEIVMLLNPAGEIVDTANASNLGRSGWVAGSLTTKGTMERIDPLRPDTTDNWQTNFGLMISGQDAADHPLRATPGQANSPVIVDAATIASLSPTAIEVGEILQLEFSLSREQRRSTGWPWISVVRPGRLEASGAGGMIDPAAYAFSGRYETSDRYVLEIATEGLAGGSYAFWAIYDDGRALYLPVLLHL